MTNMTPVPRISFRMVGIMIKSLELRGLCFMTSMSGGREANAPAAKVSIMRFTHNIWVTVIGSSEPNMEPNNTMMSAATLIVS